MSTFENLLSNLPRLQSTSYSRKVRPSFAALTKDGVAVLATFTAEDSSSTCALLGRRREGVQRWCSCQCNDQSGAQQIHWAAGQTC